MQLALANRPCAAVWLTLAMLLTLAPVARAQTGAESGVGYIDSALPTSMFRLRYDAAYQNNAPTRAEFLYPKFSIASISPEAPGPPKLESRVDTQEVGAYLEYAFSPTFSGFLDVPVRFVNPEFNANAGGLSDISAGFKYAFLYTPTQVTSFMLRGTIPTGNAPDGLGTHHVSIEPGLLFFRQLSDRFVVEGELRDWASLGGTSFAGNILRYGIGASYRIVEADWGWVAPVTELVGWTVLSGQEYVFPTAAIHHSAGETIVNAKVGVRASVFTEAVNGMDFYVGYGRALTGDVWYKNMLRVEMRLRF
jgi:hypothetical protein